MYRFLPCMQLRVLCWTLWATLLASMPTPLWPNHTPLLHSTGTLNPNISSSGIVQTLTIPQGHLFVPWVLTFSWGTLPWGALPMRGPPEHLFLPLDHPNLHTTEMQEAFTSHDFFQLMGVKSYQISIPSSSLPLSLLFLLGTGLVFLGICLKISIA